MYELPTSIELEGQSFAIRDDGDFRMVLDCFSILNDYDLELEERLLGALSIFYADIEKDLSEISKLPSIEEAVKKMYEFFNCHSPEISQKRPDYKLIDWETDEILITSAINQITGKEIRLEEYIHWWTFMGYYMAVGECPLSTVISIRHKLATNQKLEKYEKKFRAENPQYFTVDVRSKAQQEADAMVRQLWGSGKG